MKSLIIQTKQETIKLMLEDVYYIMSHPTKPHYIRIVTDGKDYDVLQKLQTIEQSYPEDFVRCHRNCLVNISKIKSIQFSEKVLTLGEKGQHKVIFSRRRHQQILQEWLKKEEK